LFEHLGHFGTYYLPRPASPSKTSTATGAGTSAAGWNVLYNRCLR
jgi:hypothetical protein